MIIDFRALRNFYHVEYVSYGDFNSFIEVNAKQLRQSISSHQLCNEILGEEGEKAYFPDASEEKEERKKCGIDWVYEFAKVHSITFPIMFVFDD